MGGVAELKAAIRAESDYLCGLRAGWNLGQADASKRFDAIVERAAQRIREARAAIAEAEGRDQ